MNDNTTGISHEQLGGALRVLHNMVPQSDTLDIHSDWRTGSPRPHVPQFGLMVETALGKQAFIELQVMTRKLDELYAENRPYYEPRDFADYATTITGIQRFLSHKLHALSPDDFKGGSGEILLSNMVQKAYAALPSVLARPPVPESDKESEKPHRLGDIEGALGTERALRDFMCLEKLEKAANAAIADRATGTPSFTILSKWSDEQAKQHGRFA